MVHGVTLSTVLKDMRLRAVVESGELFHRDFTVGQIQIQVSDPWNGMSMVDIPLTNANNAVAVVAPGDYVYLRAVGTPTALNQSFGWQVGTNSPVNSSFIALTSEEAGELEINLTIDDPQNVPVKVGFPELDDVEGHDTVAPAGPSATAIVYPTNYTSRATNEYELLESYGNSGGLYKVTARMFNYVASDYCHVWPKQKEYPPPGGVYIAQDPWTPCAGCSVIHFRKHWGHVSIFKKRLTRAGDKGRILRWQEHYG